MPAPPKSQNQVLGPFATSTPSTPATTSTPGETVPTPPLYRLRPGDLVLAAEEDAIPAIFANEDLFVDAEAGSREWNDAEPVVGLEVNGDARAYPVRLLSNHEIINDVVGGRPVAITWCPLCYTAIVFDRRIEGRELTFGVSGYLLHNNLVMYDHQTDTLWSQLLGQGVRGAYSKRRLELLPAVLTTWEAWRTEHRDTRVISAERLGQNSEQIVDPYAGYYASGVAGLTGETERDDRLPGKALVVGVVAGERARAYPLELVQTAGIINDELGPLSLLLVYDDTLQTVLLYQRRVGEQTLTFTRSPERDILRDRETGSLWNVRSGRAVTGPLAGAHLSRLTSPLVFWFAWSAIHPETDIAARG